MELTRENIVKLLEDNDKAVMRALVVINNNQTVDEQNAENTRYQNGKGFRPCHARMGTNMAEFFKRRGYLTEKQIGYWRKRDKAGNMRIAIYWKQLVEAAKQKIQADPRVSTMENQVITIIQNKLNDEVNKSKKGN